MTDTSGTPDLPQGTPVPQETPPKVLADLPATFHLTKSADVPPGWKEIDEDLEKLNLLHPADRNFLKGPGTSHDDPYPIEILEDLPPAKWPNGHSGPFSNIPRELTNPISDDEVRKLIDEHIGRCMKRIQDLERIVAALQSQITDLRLAVKGLQ